MMTVHVRFLVSKRCGTRRGMFLHFSLDLCTLDVRVWLPSNLQIFPGRWAHSAWDPDHILS